jgi:hypothetical protein
LQALDGRKLLNVQLDTAVTVDQYSLAPAAAKACTDCCRKSVSHRAKRSGVIEALAPLQSERMLKDFYSRPGTS